ncbi:LysR family transcriptional regulator [Kiloniella sp. EL199]|uniref:LysR family transcriptional regulator n=1 Tax=Kiloniella sp. EL199 TaxID=2107581 RepID=UPI000EA20848|nr:LysR family transcriptional regulator [Kiloniella sp. EL199]
MESMNAIPIFIAVVEEGSFAGAARRIGVTKSAVSKRISQLEAHLGVQLLHRSTRKLSLSEAGEQYFAHAIQSLAAAQDAEDAVAQLQRAPQGRLRINTPMSFGRLHVAPLIPEFLSTYPAVGIDMVMDDRVVDMVEGGFDLAIRVRTLEDSALIARKLAPCRNLLCASPRYLEKHGILLKLEDLRDHNCLQYAYASTTHIWQFIQNDGETVSLETKGNYQVNNSEALREALVAGVGIGRLPTFIAAEEITAGRLEALLPQYQLPSQTIHAVFPERRHLPAKVRVFVDFLVDKLGGDHPYWEDVSGL